MQTELFKTNYLVDREVMTEKENRIDILLIEDTENEDEQYEPD